MCCTGVILSGGKGKRLSSYFPTKQFLKYKGTPLIVKAIRNLPQTCSEIIVTVHDQEQRKKTQELLNNYLEDITTIRIVLDEVYFLGNIGPLNGFLSGLKYATNNKLIIKPVDTPNLIPSHYQALLELIEEENDTASFIDKSGYVSTLNVAVKEREKRLKKLIFIIKKKQQYGLKIRASDIFLAGKNIALLRVVEQAIHVLKNINTPNDLESNNNLTVRKINVFKDEVFKITNNPEYASIFKYLDAGNINWEKIDSVIRPWVGTHIYGQLSKDFKELLKQNQTFYL